MEPEADFRSRRAGVLEEDEFEEGRRERLMLMLLEVVWMDRESRRWKSPLMDPVVVVSAVERASMRRGEGKWEVEEKLRVEEGAEMYM